MQDLLLLNRGEALVFVPNRLGPDAWLPLLSVPSGTGSTLWVIDQGESRRFRDSARSSIFLVVIWLSFWSPVSPPYLLRNSRYNGTTFAFCPHSLFLFLFGRDP